MSSELRVVLFVGGVGGAKMAHGLSRCLPPGSLRIVVNVGDDFRRYGLRICPDSDTVLYTLAGRVDPVNGWGVARDTTTVLDALTGLGDDTWFRLTDRDLATHMYRTQRMADGATLTQATAELARAMGVDIDILPVTDAPVPTRVITSDYGELDFQEYFVRHRWQPEVKFIRYVGAEDARVTTAVAEAIDWATCIVFAPSNPWLSIGPILAVGDMRERLLGRDVPRVAVTPVIGGKAVKGPAAKLMAEQGLAVSARSVAGFYGALLTDFVDDVRNPEFTCDGMNIIQRDTLMLEPADRERFAGEVLGYIGERIR
ncbi:MAG: 2-phospho-L-lactate transferase [Phototrophicaceae bacterium]|nr:2-phospho-L-lactate transferase [Anaerolineae bacterium]